MPLKSDKGTYTFSHHSGTADSRLGEKKEVTLVHVTFYLISSSKMKWPDTSPVTMLFHCSHSISVWGKWMNKGMIHIQIPYLGGLAFLEHKGPSSFLKSLLLVLVNLMVTPGEGIHFSKALPKSWYKAHRSQRCLASNDIQSTQPIMGFISIFKYQEMQRVTDLTFNSYWLACLS